MFPANPFRLKGSCPRFTNPASTSVVKSVAKRPDSEQCCCLQSETMSGNSRSWKESAVKACYNIRVQASMLIQMHSWIFGRLLHVWLFWNQSIYIYRFYGFVQIPECWPRLWDVPGAKCMEISPCRYVCCATMKLCDGQCCSRCGVHSVSKKTCCLGDGDDHCELVGPQPHAHQGTVVVVAIGLGLVLLVLLVLSLSCLFLRRFHSVREPLLNPPQPAVSLLDLASNGPRGQVVAPTSTTTSIPDRCDLCQSRQVQMSRHCPGCQHRQVVCYRCNRQQPRCEVCQAGVIDYVSDSLYASESASYPSS